MSRLISLGKHFLHGNELQRWRIEDVDIAAESANLAKYSILTQAAAAMVAQANSSNDLALMLLR